MSKTDPRFKYRYHDIHLEDISDYDLGIIKSNAISGFVDGSGHSSQVPMIIDSFMSYLVSKNYKIVKKEEEND